MWSSANLSNSLRAPGLQPPSEWKKNCNKFGKKWSLIEAIEYAYDDTDEKVAYVKEWITADQACVRKNEKVFPLQTATYFSSPKVLKLLLEAGAYQDLDKNIFFAIVKDYIRYGKKGREGQLKILDGYGWGNDPTLRAEAVIVAIQEVLACNANLSQTALRYFLDLGLIDWNYRHPASYRSSLYGTDLSVIKWVENHYWPLLTLFQEYEAKFYNVDTIAMSDPASNQLVLLGEGGYGAVYKGKWQGVIVAVKVQSDATDSEQELLRESNLLKRLSHPNVVQWFVFTELGDKRALVMEFAEKGTLWDLLYETGELPWPVRFSFASDIARGMMFLHNRQVIHRDLKSLNVLIFENGRAKLADFGLALENMPVGTIKELPDSEGTIPWMAPELLGMFPHYTFRQ